MEELLISPLNFKLYKRKTKILATIGPATWSYENLEKLIRMGLNGCRLNFSHGDHKQHQETIDRIKEIRMKRGIFDHNIAIIADLQGPKIRVGKIKNDFIKVKNGDKIKITVNKSKQHEKGYIYCSYKNLVKDSIINKIIFIDDGLIQLKIISKSMNDEITCEVLVGGKIKSKKGINLPSIPISSPCLTEKDKLDLQFALKNKVDFICLSFVRTPKDIKDCHDLMKDKKFNPTGYICPIIAKIEREEAIENLIPIIKEIRDINGGIMVARGDLAVETSYHRLPILQKSIIRSCNKYGIFNICATQMLMSMTVNPLPSRAEVSDIANAIFDQTSCLMLSNETAVGKYPFLTFDMMEKVAKEADENMVEFSNSSPIFPFNEMNFSSSTDEICIFGAIHIAYKHQKIKAMIVLTDSGRTAIKVSTYNHVFHKKDCPVIALTFSQTVYNRLGIVWGINTLFLKKKVSFKKIELFIKKFLIDNKIVKKDEAFVLISGNNIDSRGSNTVRIIACGNNCNH